MTDNSPLLYVAMPQIKADEGCRLTAYPDPLSGREPWTIGYGATGAAIGPFTVWTQDQADADLQARLEALCGSLDGKIPWWRTMALPRQAVLLNMAYQLGVGGLLGFPHMLSCAEVADYADAAEAMLDSKWAHQTPNRAKRLSGQMESGNIA